MEKGEIFGYRFKDEKLLEEALTTPACKMSSPAAVDNQRLEFLGDAVLGLLAADRLYAELPECAEGELTIRRTHLVSTAALNAAAVRLDLGPRLHKNKGADESAIPANTLADAVEAILGAAWLDGGLAAAKAVFDNLGLEENAGHGDWNINNKGELQRYAQSLKPHRQPEYVTISVGGLCHCPDFKVRVSVAGLGEAVGEGHSRKQAESNAAAALLKKISEQNKEGPKK